MRLVTIEYISFYPSVIRISLNGVIKVADFGLTEDIYSRNYFKQTKNNDCVVKLPIKWMALESLHDGLFTEKTDVVRRSYTYRMHYKYSMVCRKCSMFY